MFGMNATEKDRAVQRDAVVKVGGVRVSRTALAQL